MRITISKPIWMIFFYFSLYLSFVSAIFDGIERKSLQVALITFDFMRSFQFSKSNEQTDIKETRMEERESEKKEEKAVH